MIHSDIMRFWNGKFDHDITKYYKISFCTTCMDRLDDLKRTLPRNIENNKDYPNLEFVILNYNSSDDLDGWMKENMMSHIESGRVVYYKTVEPKYYDMCHSRNVVFKLATGDIANSLDADNYTLSPRHNPSECWASYLNRMANDCPGKVIFARGKRVIHGRIGFYRDEFINLLGGYDEDLKGYGYDDHDLIKRAWHLGFTMYWWDTQYFDRLWTEEERRGKNYERDIKVTVVENEKLSNQKIKDGIYKANEGRPWGETTIVSRNFNGHTHIYS